jgi:5-formyltetrahydrofolate cyclo-ligase
MTSSTTKIDLRQEARTKLAALTPEETALFDTQITSSFFKAQSFMPQSSIACYMPLKGEVSCRSILQTLTNQSHIICLPAVTGRKDALSFRQYREGDALERGMMGPLEPTRAAREVIPDIIIIPMLGFNRDKYRLGYGSGFYDRTLEAFRRIKPIKTIGLAYSVQELTSMDIEPHDIPLDMIITEKEIIA